MYWSEHSIPQSNIDALLGNEDVTLEQLLDEDDVIQQCSQLNSSLVDFLCRADVLSSLVGHLVNEPPVHATSAAQYRHASVAVELLACNVPPLLDRLAADRRLLGQLYQLLEAPAPLNPLLASFFSRAFSLLLLRHSDQNQEAYQCNCQQVLHFLRERGDFVDLLLRHIGTSAVTDLLCSIASAVELKEDRTAALTWLNEQRLVQRLAGVISDRQSASRQDNAAEVLVSIVTQARERDVQSGDGEPRDPNPLVDAIESSELIELLLDSMLSGLSSASDTSHDDADTVDGDACHTPAGAAECDGVNVTHSLDDHTPTAVLSEAPGTAVVHGVRVLLCLLDTQSGDPLMTSATTVTQDNEKSAAGSPLSSDGAAASVVALTPCVQTACTALVSRLPQLHQLLLSPPHRPPLNTSCCRLQPPLGAVRLHIVQLLVALAATGSQVVFNELSRLGTSQVLLDLFFRYSLNNFLHAQVEKFMSYVLVCECRSVDGQLTDNVLLNHVLVECRLLRRILDEFDDNVVKPDVDAEPRCASSVRAYRGHLVVLANRVHETSKRGCNSALLRQLIASDEDTQQAWNSFVEHQLAQINDRQKVLLDSNDRSGVTVTSEECKPSTDNSTSASQLSGDVHQCLDVSSTADSAVPDKIGVCDDVFSGTAGLASLSPKLDDLTCEMTAVDDWMTDSIEAAELRFEQQCCQRLSGLVDCEWQTLTDDGDDETSTNSSVDQDDEQAARVVVAAVSCSQDSDESTSPSSPAAVAMDVDAGASDPWGESLCRSSEQSAAAGDSAVQWANFDDVFRGDSAADRLDTEDTVTGDDESHEGSAACNDRVETADAVESSLTGVVAAASTAGTDEAGGDGGGSEGEDVSDASDLQVTSECQQSQAATGKNTDVPVCEASLSPDQLAHLQDNYRFLTCQRLMNGQVVTCDDNTSEPVTRLCEQGSAGASESSSVIVGDDCAVSASETVLTPASHPT